MTRAAQMMQGPAAVLAWADRHTKLIERATMSLVVSLIVGYCGFAVMGVDGVIAAAFFVGTIAALVAGTKFAPQITGTVVSTVGIISSLLIVSTMLSPITMLIGIDEYAIIYSGIFLVVAAVSWLIPSKNMHRGWTTFVGQMAVAVTVPLAVYLGTTPWRGLVVAAGAIVGLIVVGVRIRHVPKEHRGGWRAKTARASAMTIVLLLLGVMLSMGNSGSAKAWPWDWVGDKVSGAVDDTICSITRPDLSGEVVGTGPESILPNMNFAKAKRLKPSDADDKEYPQYAGEAAVFEPGANNSLSDNYTLYEIAGLRGISWINWQKTAEGDENCAMMPFISVMVGNFMLKFSTYLLQPTIAFKEYSQVENPLEPLYAKTGPLASDLFVYFFVPGASAMFLIVGISMVLKSIKTTGMREALGDVGGAIFVCFIGGVAYGGVATASFANPEGNGFYILGSTLDHMGGQLNRGIAELSFAMIEDNNGTMCVRPGGNSDDIAPNAAGQRITSCLLAETLAYKPWAAGQFGAAGMEPIESSGATAGSDPRPSEDASLKGEDGKLPCYNDYKGCEDLRSYLIAQMGGPDIGARRDSCLQEGGDASGDYEWLKKCDPYTAVAAQLYERMEKGKGDADGQEAAAIMSAYQASGFMPHVPQAVSSYFGVLTVGIGLSVMALITLFWHAYLFSLFLFGPIRLLWAVYPGKAHLATNWITEVVGTFTQRILYGMAMTILILVVSMIFAMNVAAGIKMLWSILALVGTWIVIRKIQSAASSKSPNMANYGQSAVAIPAAAGGYLAYRGGSYAAKGATKAGVKGAAKTAKFGAKSTRVAAVSGTRAGTRAMTSTVDRAQSARLNHLGDRALDGDDKALAKVNKKFDKAEARDSRKHARAVVVAKTRQVGGNIRDAYNMSAREQISSERRTNARKANETAYRKTVDTSGENLRSRRADRAADQDLANSVLRDRERQRAAKSSRAADRSEEAKRAAKKFGPGNPVATDSAKKSSNQKKKPGGGDKK